MCMGAEKVWSVLHEEPKRQREVAAAKKGLSLSQQQVAHWRQQLHVMHHLGKQYQHTTNHLLETKHLTDLSDTYGKEGPARYFHCSLGTEQEPQHLV
ncbi:hypothetical protein JD844_013237 [Phrynosoma platyrhinos]|uniref:Uncharacterized protein n=1 Tax=Phrynosoma platyrhinos TaxID=52577 RepID=A0ABQ7TKX6_PHRPL|nr:hypothetical protein JD844_013237 [Phrynosoma platyrhinos]